MLLHTKSRNQNFNSYDGPTYIKELRFSGYKHFAPTELILSSVNLLLGGNLSGKTSLLQLIRTIEALTHKHLSEQNKWSNPALNQSNRINQDDEIEEMYYMFDYHHKNPIHIECVTNRNLKINIDLSHDNFIRYADRSIDITIKELEENHRKIELNSFEINTFYYNPNVIQKVKKNLQLRADDKLKSDGSNIIQYLMYLQHNSEKLFSVINELCSVAFPEIKEIEVDTDASYPTLKIYYIGQNGKKYPMEILNDSLLHFLTLITSIICSDYNIFLLDVPDYNLGQNAITILDESIKSRAHIAQFFVATNSSKLIKYFKLSDIIVLNKNKQNGITTIHQLTEEQVGILSNLLVQADLYEMWWKGVINIVLLGENNQ